MKVVEIKRPDHATGKSPVGEVVNFDAQRGSVVIADPLIVIDGVHAHGGFVVVRGATVRDDILDLIPSQEALFAGDGTRNRTTRRSGADTGV